MAMAAASFATAVVEFPWTRPSLTAYPDQKSSILFRRHPPPRTLMFGVKSKLPKTSSSSSSSSSPWLMLPPTFEDKNMVYQFYSLADDKVVSLNKNKKKRSGGDEEDEEEEEVPDDKSEIVGSSHGWLALFNRQNLDLFLSNPISRRHIKLPPIRNLPDIPQENLDGGFGCVNNVIISSSDPYDDDCRAMIVFGPLYELAFCCPSRRSTNWTLLRAYHSYLLAYSTKPNLFLQATPEYSDIQAWDLRDPLSPIKTNIAKIPPWNLVFYGSKQELQLKRLCGLRYQFLVVKDEQLFHVKQYVLYRVRPNGSIVVHPTQCVGGGYDDDEDDDSVAQHKTVGFDVHEYDPKTGSFVYMDGGLGGLALFVGPNDGGFALSPDEFPELKPNSIYYTDSTAIPDDCDEPYGGYDVGIFDYEKETFSSCYYPCGLKSIFTKIEPIPRWFTPVE